jgi:hypothetical protein
VPLVERREPAVDESGVERHGNGSGDTLPVLLCGVNRKALGARSI